MFLLPASGQVTMINEIPAFQFYFPLQQRRMDRGEQEKRTSHFGDLNADTEGIDGLIPNNATCTLIQRTKLYFEIDVSIRNGRWFVFGAL